MGVFQVIFGDTLFFLQDLFQAANTESWFGVFSAILLFLGTGAFGLLLLPSQQIPAWLRALSGFPLAFILWGGGSIALYLLGVSVSVVGIVFLAVAALSIVGGIVTRSWKDLWNTRALAAFLLLLLPSYMMVFFGWGETADGTIRASSGAWGDGVLHTLNAEAFLKRSGGDLSMPAFSGELVREPFGYDGVAAVLRSLGFSVGGAFTLPAAGLLAALLGWTGYLARCLARANASHSAPSRVRRVLPFFLTALLVCFGSGIQWIVMAVRTGSFTPSTFFGAHSPPWDKVEEWGLIWANHLNTFASQKHFLLAAAFLSLLSGIFFLLLEKSTEGRRRFLWIAALGTGLLPLFHAHAYIAAGLLWIAFWMQQRTRLTTVTGVSAVLLALPVFWWYTGAVAREGFFRFAPGYLAPANPVGWALFWIVNLGGFLPLLVIALRRNDQRSFRRLLAVPIIGLFLLGNLFQFQPYHWDNHKLFLFALLLGIPMVVDLLLEWSLGRRGKNGAVSWRRRTGLALVILVLTLTTVSETATYLRFRRSYPLSLPETRAVARDLDRQLPRDAVVLAATETLHNHPVTLTGRTLALGYGGWIWTRGLPLEERSAGIKRLLESTSLSELCRSSYVLGISHIILGSEEGQVWGSDTVERLLGMGGFPSGEQRTIMELSSLCAQEPG